MLQQQSRAAAGTTDTGGSKGPIERSATALAEKPPARKWGPRPQTHEIMELEASR